MFLYRAVVHKNLHLLRRWTFSQSTPIYTLLSERSVQGVVLQVGSTTDRPPEDRRLFWPFMDQRIACCQSQWQHILTSYIVQRRYYVLCMWHLLVVKVGGWVVMVAVHDTHEHLVIILTGTLLRVLPCQEQRLLLILHRMLYSFHSVTSLTHTCEILPYLSKGRFSSSLSPVFKGSGTGGIRWWMILHS